MKRLLQRLEVPLLSDKSVAQARTRLLNLLLDAYERRRPPGEAASQHTPKAASVSFAREKMPEYWADHSADTLNAYNEAALDLESLGIVEIAWVKDAPRRLIHRVSLVESLAPVAYESISREPASARWHRLESVAQSWLVRWRGDPKTPAWAMRFAHDLAVRAATGKSTAGLAQGDDLALETICRCLDGAFRLESDTSYRVFSARELGDSKALEQVLSRLERILREYYPDGAQLPEDRRSVLSLIGLLPNPQLTMLAGPCLLTTPDGIVDVSLLPEIGLSDRGLDAVTAVTTTAKRVITIENLTPFYEWVEHARSKRVSDSLAVYVGGFLTRSQRRFIARLSAALLPGAVFRHWSDIDGGGFRILRQVQDAAACDVEPLLMDESTYLRCLPSAKPLGSFARKQLEHMRRDPLYQKHLPVLELILKHGSAVEQESVGMEDLM